MPRVDNRPGHLSFLGVAMILLQIAGDETLDDLREARDGVRLLRLDPRGAVRVADIAETVSALDDAILELL